MSRRALLPNRELLEDALREPRAFYGARIWYRDQHLRGAERGVDVRECFRAAFIRARLDASGRALLRARRG
jgi:hypothetical protein